MRAKKSFGQHFLTSEGIAQRIADSLLKEAGKPNVLEVGPGKAMLTKYLLEKDFELKCVEADSDMVDFLNANFPALKGKIIAEDFLKLDLGSVFPDGAGDGQPFYIIGNFPYNISSQIVFKMVEHRLIVPQLVGMFQKEMAQRIIATPGGKDYGVISVLTQAFYEGKYLFSVAPGNFNPPPKVQSGVIRLVRKEEELGCDPILFRKVVKQAFSQRRKMLRNTVRPFFEANPAVLEDDYFKQRPEVLSVRDFVDLTNRISGG